MHLFLSVPPKSQQTRFELICHPFVNELVFDPLVAIRLGLQKISDRLDQIIVVCIDALNLAQVYGPTLDVLFDLVGRGGE